MKLSDNLKNIRKENNLSQEQLAEKLGVSRQAVSKWESGQSYPEMDKVLLICKLFNYNIDELMNENVKEVNETKQSKINFNKYVDDFFNFITKTVNMLSSMNFKQKVKCFAEQIIVIIFLLCIFAIIGAISSSILEGLFAGIHLKIYYVIINVLESIYIILAFIIGIIVLLHIFKIRYLDYYEFIKFEENNEINDNNEMDSESQEKFDNSKKQKIFIEKNKEKIIIRDPEHTQFKFLTGIAKLILWFVKIFATLTAIWFSLLFIVLVACTILSFVFAKTGFVFFGVLLGLISAITIDLIILILLYNFITSRKSKKNILAIIFIIALAVAGISIGLISIGITKFNYIENSEFIEDVYNIEMTDNMSIINWNGKIEYIEEDIDDVKIVAKHSKYYLARINNKNEIIYINFYQDGSKNMEFIRANIEDINNKQIKDYYNFEIYVYASKENIKKLK